MRKITTTVLIILSLNCFSQSNKSDSLLQAEANNFVDSLLKSTSLAEFMSFINDNATAKKTDFDILDGFYKFYINNKYSIWLETKKKKAK